MKPRKTSIKRETKETSVSVIINLDGTGKTTINTGIKFLDHLIGSFGKHSMMDLVVKAKYRRMLKGDQSKQIAGRSAVSYTHLTQPTILLV